jgi:aspartate kinase
MALLVKKFGGTSVGNIERIHAVADHVVASLEQGHQVVVVLSAMHGETDRLIALAQQSVAAPDACAYDMLLSSGEQVTVALLAMVLIERGLSAQAMTGWQAGIRTTDRHKKARITDIKTERLSSMLEARTVPIVAGFQGLSDDQNITTFGRGGSDTTAVALAAALRADECQIYTDVDGVYTTDPRVVPSARRLNRITFEEMLELASLGAKVLQIRSVEFAGKYNVPMRVLSSFVDGVGTLITYEESKVEQPIVSGVAFDRNQAQLTCVGVPNKPGFAGQILGKISEAGIDVDMIVQNMPNRDGQVDFSFTVQRDDFTETRQLLEAMRANEGYQAIHANDQIAKLSVVGVGMRSHAGVATQMFAALAKEGINIHMISTSEIKISVVIDEKYLELGARTLHDAFNLGADDQKNE